jgi:hypothetical protein
VELVVDGVILEISDETCNIDDGQGSLSWSPAQSGDARRRRWA